MHRIIPILGTLFAFALAFAPTSALARKTVFHGSVCENIYPASHSLGGDVYEEAGGLRNASSTWRYIICPITRFDGASGNITDIEVSLYSTDADMWCSVSSLNRYNSSGSSSGNRSAGGTGYRLIDFGNPNLSNSYEGDFTVFCVLASGSSIRSISVDEN